MFKIKLVRNSSLNLFVFSSLHKKNEVVFKEKDGKNFKNENCGIFVENYEKDSMHYS